MLFEPVSMFKVLTLKWTNPLVTTVQKIARNEEENKFSTCLLFAVTDVDILYIL